MEDARLWVIKPRNQIREALRLAVSSQSIEQHLRNGGAWYARSALGDKPRLRWIPLRTPDRVNSNA